MEKNRDIKNKVQMFMVAGIIKVGYVERGGGG